MSVSINSENIIVLAPSEVGGIACIVHQASMEEWSIPKLRTEIEKSYPVVNSDTRFDTVLAQAEGALVEIIRSI